MTFGEEQHRIEVGDAGGLDRSRRARDTKRLFVPGEIEAEFEAADLRDGILLTQDTVAGIAFAAKSLKVGGLLEV